MAATCRTPIRDKDLKGLKYFNVLGSLLDRLHDNATSRDRAGNRRLYYDQYACLLLLFFFNPVVKRLTRHSAGQHARQGTAHVRL